MIARVPSLGADVHLTVQRRLEGRMDPALRNAVEVRLLQRHIDDVEPVVAGRPSDLPVSPNPASTPWASSSVPLLT